jgi:hypothetical protein
MLASVGLDNSIWIWDGYTFGKLEIILQSKLISQIVYTVSHSTRDLSRE